MNFGLIGSGSWATALAKILTDNKVPLGWLVRTQSIADHIRKRHHNPNYLSSAYLETQSISFDIDIRNVVRDSNYIIIATPSAYIIETLKPLGKDAFHGKKVISAVKGIIPQNNVLLNDYLRSDFGLPIEDYFTIMGPCHAEEVAAEKLSYLTFSGVDEQLAMDISDCFRNSYLNTVVNDDIYGVQFAAILKNIYALAAGIAHGLEYGDNFLSVLIANSADEMAGFLRKVGVHNVQVGIHEGEDPVTHKRRANYAASVYLGDLLVTCYSLYSRNRTFGNMIGKGYSVKSAQLELNMVAEGYYASKCIYVINQNVKADMPIAETVFKILWEQDSPAEAFKRVEEVLV